MDGNLRMCCDLAAWPARRLEKMGLCYWAGQPTSMAFFRLLSSPVGAGPGKLLVHVFLGSGRMEFLGKAQNGLDAARAGDKPGLSEMRKGKSQEKDGSPYSWLKERNMKHYLINSEQRGFF